ncbi:MAG: hypothetical protein INR64_01790 [Caulobacteraceae bacterium]|nr:hypothetical protein [Caulobacter sp.]
MDEASWAGVGFRIVGRDDARFFRAPGLYAFVRDDPEAGRLMLFAGQAECLAAEAGPAHPLWVEALRLGVNELHVGFPIPRRVDRLQLLSRIVRHVQPILNVVDEAHPAPDVLRLRA